MKIKVFPKKDSLFYIILTFLVLISILIFVFFIVSGKLDSSNETDNSEDRSYHILVLGRYENELFLQKVFKGAEKLSPQYNAVVEFYVPHSQAEDESLQELFDYATFVNADGVIAYIESAEGTYDLPHGPNGTPIPLITTGLYNSSLQQVSFIGNSYWEIGRTIGEEAVKILQNQGKACLINSEFNNNPYYSNLTNAIQQEISQQKDISYEVLEQYDIETLKNLKNLPEDEKILFICLTEQETIKTAQGFQELNLDKKKNIKLIGFGSNEICLHYLNNGIIYELISVDPERIGETSITELFEYRNKGYANSYVAAEVQITRSPK